MLIASKRASEEGRRAARDAGARRAASPAALSHAPTVPVAGASFDQSVREPRHAATCSDKREAEGVNVRRGRVGMDRCAITGKYFCR